MILRALTHLASPAGRGAKLSTFIFHRVPAQPDPLLPDEPDAQRFEQMLSWITGQFQVLAPLEACERLSTGSLPARAAVITFDDGYRDNAEVALPILQRHGVSAAFFIATGFLDGGIMFNDRVIEAIRAVPGERVRINLAGIDELDLSSPAARRGAINALLRAIKHLMPGDRDDAVEAIEARLGVSATESPMMSRAQVRQLHAAGMAIGGHTRWHPILSVLAPDDAREAIQDGRDDLTELLGHPPPLFAYPNGRQGRDWGSEHAQMVKDAGFRFAFTTDSGAARFGDSPHVLPRFTPWARGRVGFGGQALRNLLQGARGAESISDR